MRTRFAPSPTGSLHVGNARIAILDWLLTRQSGGAFLLRIEDTDRERNLEGADERIYRDLRWLGLDWDEGPVFEGRPVPGPHGPYRQSQRLDRYRAAAERLLERDAAYPCFCSDADISTMRETALARGEQPHYDGRCARLSPPEREARRAAGEPAAVRFRVPAGAAVTVRDAVYGEVRFRSDEIGDFILLRSDGLPTYNFAAVVDDIAMEITHVIRGSGHLSNTPRQRLLYDALGSAPPVFAHVPMVLGPDRQKLSKRNGARALSDYREEGFHPDAIVNYLSLLSWSSPTGDEVLTRDRLIEEISLERMGAADVVFDPDKLRWLSARHIERMSLPDLVDAVRPFLAGLAKQLDEDVLRDAVASIRSRLSTFAGIRDAMAELEPAADPASLDAGAVPVLLAATDVLESLPAWDLASLEAALKQASKRAAVRGAAFYVPLRRALTGRDHGPALAAVLLVQGKLAVLRRLGDAAAAAEAA